MTDADDCDWLWNPDWQPEADAFISKALHVCESAFLDDSDLRGDEIRTWAHTVQEWKRTACLEQGYEPLMARSTTVREWRTRLDEILGEVRLSQELAQRSERLSALIRTLDRTKVENRLQALRAREPSADALTNLHLRLINEWEQRLRRISERAGPSASLTDVTAAQADLARLVAEIDKAPRLWLNGEQRPASDWSTNRAGTYGAGSYGTGEGSRRDD